MNDIVVEYFRILSMQAFKRSTGRLIAPSPIDSGRLASASTMEIMMINDRRAKMSTGKSSIHANKKSRLSTSI
jgi:hypothetical protein